MITQDSPFNTLIFNNVLYLSYAFVPKKHQGQCLKSSLLCVCLIKGFGQTQLEISHKAGFVRHKFFVVAVVVFPVRSSV